MAAWEFTDGWLLAAVGLRGPEDCSLSGLIGATDALNHLIPLPEELEQSLGRLIGSGVVEARPGRRFGLTPLGLDLYERRARPPFEQAPSLVTLLREVALVASTWSLEPDEFTQAFDEYRHRMQVPPGGESAR